MNNKMVGVVLNRCKEEPGVTRDRPMQDDWLLLPSNCIATDLVYPSRKIRGSKNNGKLKMEVAHFGRSIEVLVVNCAWWDHLPQLE